MLQTISRGKSKPSMGATEKKIFAQVGGELMLVPYSVVLCRLGMPDRRGSAETASENVSYYMYTSNHTILQ